MDTKLGLNLYQDSAVCKNCGGAIRTNKFGSYHTESFMKRCFNGRSREDSTYAEAEDD